MATPLGVLDLVPISSGSTATQALINSIDLARHTESLGYNALLVSPNTISIQASVARHPPCCWR